jgi:hypothetical protein
LSFDIANQRQRQRQRHKNGNKKRACKWGVLEFIGAVVTSKFSDELNCPIPNVDLNTQLFNCSKQEDYTKQNVSSESSSGQCFSFGGGGDGLLFSLPCLHSTLVPPCLNQRKRADHTHFTVD